MALSILLPLRAIQGIFAIIILGLSSYVAHWYDADTLTASPSQINFLIFLSLYTIVSLAYLELAPRFAPRASNQYVHFGLELINSLFYFAGFVALAVFLSRLLFCRGSVCNAARADAVFAAFGWLTWMASTTLIALEMFKGGFRKRSGNEKPGMQETIA